MNIEIRKAVKSYRGLVVLDGFSLSLPPRGTVCLIGPSGCGKTTLLNCISGLETLDSGSVSGVRNLKIAYLFQEDRLLPWNTAEQNVAAALPKKSRSQAREWLSLVGLEAARNQYPSQLSGGMRRRVALARTLAYGGDLYLLDEPFQRLDDCNREKIAELIRERTAGRLSVLVTHDRREADCLADLVYFLSGTPIKIWDKWDKASQKKL